MKCDITNLGNFLPSGNTQLEFRGLARISTIIRTHSFLCLFKGIMETTLETEIILKGYQPLTSCYHSCEMKAEVNPIIVYNVVAKIAITHSILAKKIIRGYENSLGFFFDKKFVTVIVLEKTVTHTHTLTHARTHTVQINIFRRREIKGSGS